MSGGAQDETQRVLSDYVPGWNCVSALGPDIYLGGDLKSKQGASPAAMLRCEKQIITNHD